MAPPQSPSRLPAWSVVVPSCDNYNDTWPFFFHFFFKYWPDVPKPVYLISNTTSFADERVRTIRVGPDYQWSSNVHLGLAHVPEDFLFMILDDFLLNATVDEGRVEEAWRQFHRFNGVYLSTDDLKRPGEAVPESWFCQIKAGQFYVGLTAAFFQKAHMQKLTDKPGLNIWRTEDRLKQLARQNSGGHFFLKPGTPPMINYVESIKGNFWKPMSLDYLAQNGLKPDLNRRPCPPQGRDPISRFYRSVLKRRIGYANRLNQWLGGRFRARVIQPLAQPARTS